VKAYLVLYNVASALAWASVLYLAVQHLSASPSTIENISKRVPSFVPPAFSPIYRRAITTYAALGEHTKWVQTAATMEVVHSLVGFVRSPVQTTAMQVASRLYLVWGVADRFAEVRSPSAALRYHLTINKQAQNSPLYATMVLSWSLTEVIRYSFYAVGLLGIEPGFLLWLRYTTFYLLYPTGAGSEAFVCFATLPLDKPILEWDAWALGRGFLFFLWWPGAHCYDSFCMFMLTCSRPVLALYFLYSYMMVQRRKVFGFSSSKVKTQ
jgi:very-long-chain (3R)-3-hydroxyacyl-CoA dehydratase